ncbi:MAG: serine hydrolase [Euryarchaeota archaeon]|nr:serine hydrolase [Euryarchaeota archaeon]
MEDRLIGKKGFVLAIIILFVSASTIIPATGHLLNNNATLLSKKQIVVDETLFDKEINFLMKLGHIPSMSACLIKNNSVVWSKGYGYYDISNKKEASNHTIYMVGSISKSFTATALLQLYEQGLVNLDDDVNTYLPFSLRNPNFPNITITVRMLLAHQSSLVESLSYIRNFFFEYSEDWLKEYLVPGGSIYDPSVWSSQYKPGEKFSYANIGFELLGLIIRRVTNESIDTYCTEHIFEPLGMDNSSYHMTDFNVGDLAVSYVWRLGAYIPLSQYDIGSSAAGGIRTTVLDLSHFLIAHMNNGVYNGSRILKEDTINLMHTIQYPNTSDYGYQYGLGWIIDDQANGDTFEGHAGSVFGGLAYMFYRASDHVGFIFFINMNRAFSFVPHPIESFSLKGIQFALLNKANDY